jgi:hypothetical protein
MSDAWNPFRLTAEDRFPPPLAVVVLLIFVAGTLYTGLHHEPWRDEADAWLAARDLPLSHMVPDWTAHAGTPVLWYLILKFLLLLRLPYVAETITNLLFMWSAAAILLLAAPLTRVTKILLLASYFFSYEYAVIARSYSLAILLIFTAAAMYKTRESHALRFAVVVALLFSTNVHGAIVAGLLLVTSTLRSRVANAIMIAGALLAFWQLLMPPGEANPLAMGIVPMNAVTPLRDVFLPFASSPWTAILAIVIIGLIAVSIRGSWRALGLLMAALTALIALFTAVWFGGLRHSGIILIVVIAAVWIADRVPVSIASKAAAFLLNVTLLFSAVFAFSIAKTDIQYAFSGSKEMAEFIDHRFDGYDIAAHGFYQAEALLPYLPQRKFFYIALGEEGTHLKWNAAMRRGGVMPYDVAVTNAKEHFAASKRPWLLLLNRRMWRPERLGFRLIHATSVVVFRNLDERYWLYAPD